ncbi:lineage-specific thermal regulator protein [Maioricimonas rarisocia]|uniref:Lineage-specific thermal regulator protein n=2 Tax=Maioricimonas rarisocia TaxID=2528026 RepID=A0A517Z985_9PLAN|nr:lineage-specific thermal regulator protein [Maioricimonas rarisocia]
MDAFSPELLRGSLDLMVLAVLTDGPKYGYLIQQRLKESSGERLQVQAGTLYPILHRLEQDRLVQASWDESTGRRRKWYELTTAGRQRLTSRVQEWNDFVACIQGVIGNVAEVPPQPS